MGQSDVAQKADSTHGSLWAICSEANHPIKVALKRRALLTDLPTNSASSAPLPAQCHVLDACGRAAKGAKCGCSC